VGVGGVAGLSIGLVDERVQGLHHPGAVKGSIGFTSSGFLMVSLSHLYYSHVLLCLTVHYWFTW
jgi:hypothetical protein